MLQPHEYSIIGHNRAAVGRYIWAASVVLAATGVAASHYVANIAQAAGLAYLSAHALAFPISTGTIYGISYLLFNKWLWRHSWVSKLLDFPDLRGRWSCTGTTIGGDHTGPWDGEIIIDQTWDKIWVYLKTASSKSRSVSASIIKEPSVGYILMYSYKNEADIAAQDLHSHVGYCEIRINNDLNSGEGEYFNSKGRTTFGNLKIKRR